MSKMPDQVNVPGQDQETELPDAVETGREKGEKGISRLFQQRNDPESDWKAERSYRVRNLSKETIKLINRPDHKNLVVLINPETARTIDGDTLNAVDQRALDELRGNNKITIQPLAYSQDADYVIQNLTARRISINHNAFKDKSLFVPAFGSRNINGNKLLDLDYLGWARQGLIEIKQEKATEEENVGIYAFVGVAIILLMVFVIVSGLMVIFGSETVTWRMVGVGTLIGIVIIGIALFLANRRTGNTFANMGGWLKLLPGVALVLATGIGLPLATIYFYGSGQQLLQTDILGLNTLGRVMQATFISVAAMLPAFLFYLFGRQQVEKQKENFYREAMILDPNVWSRSEAENKYDPLLNSVFDSGNSPFSILLLVISTALLVLGWVITLSPVGSPSASITNLTDFFAPDRSPFTFGFLGVYFFTVNMIYRRYVRADLTPKTYAYICVRLLITIVLIWALSTLPQFSEGSFLDTSLSAIAFVIGIFPESGLTLMQDYFNKVTSKRVGQHPDQLSLTKLEGMNLYDQARLLEEGIDNIENLAHHNLMELIVRTRIPTQRLVDMFDQAILYLHLGPDDQANNLRLSLKTLGVRTATDLIACQTEINAFAADEKYKDLVKKLKVIITSLKDDEWFSYIKGWRDNSSVKAEAIDDPYQFYNQAMGLEIQQKKDTSESRARPAKRNASR